MAGPKKTEDPKRPLQLTVSLFQFQLNYSPGIGAQHILKPGIVRPTCHCGYPRGARCFYPPETAEDKLECQGFSSADCKGVYGIEYDVGLGEFCPLSVYEPASLAQVSARGAWL